MIQRVQSIYLLLASGSFFGTFLAPFAESEVAVPGTVLADQHFTTGDSTGMIIGFAVAGLSALVAIFLYNNRKLQINVSRVALLAGLLAVVLGVLAFMQDGQAMGEVDVAGEAGGLLPFVGAILTFLGIRGVRADEKLVRSADRLR